MCLIYRIWGFVHLFIYILSVENYFSKLKVSEGNIIGIGMYGNRYLLQTKGGVLFCHLCQVDPVLKKLQDRYRGPEPSDMVEMFEGEQFFAAFERGISIDMGMVVLSAPASLIFLAPGLFLLGALCLVYLLTHSPWTLSPSHFLVHQLLCLLFPIKTLFTGLCFLSHCCSLQRAISLWFYDWSVFCS